MAVSRKTGFRISGVKEQRRFLKDLEKLPSSEGLKIARETAEEIMKGSIERAPIKTGALEMAHFMEEEKIGPAVQRILVQINSSIAPYAAQMHEGIMPGVPYKLGKRSRIKNEGRQPHYGRGVGWKFMKRSFDAAIRGYDKRIADELVKGIVKAAALARKAKKP